MKTATGDLPKKAACEQISVLMESPLYWTMNIAERLAFIQHIRLQEGNFEATFRQRVLAWIRTGVLKRVDEP